MGHVTTPDSGRNGTDQEHDPVRPPGDANFDSNELCRWVLETLAEAVFVVDEHDTIIHGNPAAHALHGYAPGELIGYPISLLREGATAEIARQQTAIKAFVAEHGTWHGEFQIHRQDGQLAFAAVRVAKLPSDQNYWVYGQRDITDQRHIDHSTREMIRQFEVLAELSDEIHWVCNSTCTQLFYLSPSFEHVWGRSRAELFANPRAFLESVHPDDLSVLLSDLNPQFANGANGFYTQNFRIIRPDGNIRWIKTRCLSVRQKFGDGDRVVGRSTDVTERKLMERALRESSEDLERRVAERTNELRENEQGLRLLRTMVDGSNDAMYILDPRTSSFVDVNQRACVQLGYTRAELLDLGVVDIEASQSLTESHWARHVEELRRTGSLLLEGVHKRKDGTCFAVEIGVTYAALGSQSYMFAVARDISERKQAEATLRENERRLREILDGIFVFVALLSPEGVILDINRAPLDATGLRREDIVGTRVWDSVVWAGLPELQARVREVLNRAAAGETVRVDLPVHVTKDLVWTMDVGVSPITDATGKVVQIVASAVDITQRLLSQEEARRHREELTQVLRLATAGEMATSIAHEINQPLTAIISSAHTLRTILSRQTAAIHPGLPAIAASIEEQVMRVGDVVHGLRDLVRKGKSKRASHDINGVVRSVLNLISMDARLIGVAVQADYDETLPPLNFDSVQIQQVVLNLARNALDAIKTAGSETRTINIGTARHSPQFAVVTLSDSGPGISPGALETVFDAFYTTKPSGLGMGLAISRSIIESHGGGLWAESEFGRGATFRFTIPLT